MKVLHYRERIDSAGTALFVAGSLAFEPAPTRWTASLAGSLAYQGVLISGFNFVVNLWLLRRYRPRPSPPSS